MRWTRGCRKSAPDDADLLDGRFDVSLRNACGDTFYFGSAFDNLPAPG